MQKIVIGVVVLAVVLVGGYFFLMPADNTADNTKEAPVSENIEEEKGRSIEEQAKPSVVSESKVLLKNFAFSPNTLRIKAGTKVIWTNEDVASHTVTSDSGAFGSELLNPGKSFEHTFAVKGTFSYHCEPHPSMKATVIVE